MGKTNRYSLAEILKNTSNLFTALIFVRGYVNVESGGALYFMSGMTNLTRIQLVKIYGYEYYTPVLTVDAESKELVVENYDSNGSFIWVIPMT